MTRTNLRVVLMFFFIFAVRLNKSANIGHHGTGTGTKTTSLVSTLSSFKAALRSGTLSLLMFSHFYGLDLSLIPSAAASTQVAVDPGDVKRLERGLQEVNFLLDNW